jgi:hypothetical protein
MAKTASINARIEPEVKEKAESIFAALGISASDAIGLFYRQVTYRRGLPLTFAFITLQPPPPWRSWSVARVRLYAAQPVGSLTT